ncbi:MAG TPA: hypothetical protein QGF02_01430 [Candidatus Babeliales bacterium]|nr:hypothetical protein [Candidatus Babeliales bacterium]
MKQLLYFLLLSALFSPHSTSTKNEDSTVVSSPTVQSTMATIPIEPPPLTIPPALQSAIEEENIGAVYRLARREECSDAKVLTKRRFLERISFEERRRIFDHPLEFRSEMILERVKNNSTPAERAIYRLLHTKDIDNITIEERDAFPKEEWELLEAAAYEEIE